MSARTVVEILEDWGVFSTQRLEVLEILEILQVCQLMTSEIFGKYKGNECQNGRRDIRGIGVCFLHRG